jgi:hypothetical protein
MYLSEVRPILSQGDIFTQVDLIDSATPQSPSQRFDVIVLSHTCEIQKPSNSIALVCAVRPLSEIENGHRGNFQMNRVINAMYLEPIENLPESFIDFRYIFRVNKTFLEEYVREGFKIASFNDEAQLALTTFFYRFLARKTPVTVAVKE